MCDDYPANLILADRMELVGVAENESLERYNHLITIQIQLFNQGIYNFILTVTFLIYLVCVDVWEGRCVQLSQARKAKKTWK